MTSAATPPTIDGQVTSTDRKALIAAWLGWAFDGLDGMLYVLVATQFVRQLVAAEHGTTVDALKKSPDLISEANLKSAIIQGVFLVGWALGGMVFGRIGDRIGRCRTLTLTVITYAAFTGLSFFAANWWHLLIFRFLAALGIGGEWAAGSALVCETMHPKHRAWAGGTLQSGYTIGALAASFVVWLFANLDPKWVFLVGVAPAFATIWIRRAVPEPQTWVKAATSERPPRVTELFSRELWWTTVRVLIQMSVTVTVTWAFLFYVPVVIRTMPDTKGWSDERLARLIASVPVCFFAFNVLGNYLATYTAKYLGNRLALFLFMLAAMLTYLVGFRAPPTLGNIYVITTLAAFFTLSLFAIYPLYIPPMFPTLVRTLGAGLTYNAGRIVAAIGTVAIALAGGAAKVSEPYVAVWWLGWLYVPALLMCAFLPKVHGRDGDRA